MHDIVMRGGIVYDGEGGSPYAADVAIDADLISAVMPAIGDRGRWRGPRGPWASGG